MVGGGGVARGGGGGLAGGSLRAAVDAVAHDDVVAEAAHRGHGGALLALHHGRHPSLSDEPTDTSQSVLPRHQLRRLS